jgi:putative ABC transport system permease protein
VLLLAWRGVRHNLGRYVATLIAIMTGVAFFTATGFVSDRVIDALEGDVDRQFSGVDAAIVVDASPTSDNADFADELRIGGTTADDIAALPEVEAIAGDLTGSVAFLAADGSTFADDATGRLWVEDDDLNPVDVIDGTAPVGDGQIAVDRALADEHELTTGDDVTILTLGGEFPATVVGITAFGDTDAIDPSGTVSISPVNAFDWLNSGQAEFTELRVRGNVGEPELRAAIEPLTPPGFVVQTGDDYRQEKRGQIGAFGRGLKWGLQGFALLALFVGGFVIYNTFSVIVAQRLRELAVLAAIGATPKQLKRSLRYEGLVVGLLGSALGVALGFALTFGLIFVLERLGVSLPGSGIRVAPATVIQGLLAGTIITLVSVMIPARRAAKTEPIEAMRQAAVESTALSRARTIPALVLTVLGAIGLFTAGGALLGVAALALFVGVVMAGPVIAVVGSRLLRPLLERFGLEGRLAADNTSRNPKRTATTSNALLIGVFLVTLVSVAGTSIKDFAVEQINELSTADYIIESDGGTIDDELVDDLIAIDGVETVVPFRRESVTINGDATALSTADFEALSSVTKIEFVEGSFDDLVAGTIIAVDQGIVADPDVEALTVGSTATLVDSAGDTVELEVVGLVEGNLDTFRTGAFVDATTFDGFVGDTAPTVAFIDVASGAQTDTEEAIDDLTSRRPDITVTRGNAIGQLVGAIFDFLISAVDGLLVMSVVIALIGIVNTLSLSILERRRELGLLRVVGMVDQRVRRMVRIESVLIAGLGTVTGVVLGTFMGVGLILSIARLSDADIAVSIPWLLLGGILVLGVVLGFLASLIPARRSTRLEVLDAINAT